MYLHFFFTWWLWWYFLFLYLYSVQCTCTCTICRCKHLSLVKYLHFRYLTILRLLTFLRYYGVVTHQPGLNFWLVTEFVTGHCLAKLLQQPDLKVDIFLFLFHIYKYKYKCKLLQQPDLKVDTFLFCSIFTNTNTNFCNNQTWRLISFFFSPYFTKALH